MKSRCRRSTTMIDPTVESFSSNSGARVAMSIPNRPTHSVVGLRRRNGGRANDSRQIPQVRGQDRRMGAARDTYRVSAAR